MPWPKKGANSMNQPTDKNNFIIEVTSEQLDKLRDLYIYVDEEPYVDMHYSPYWKEVSSNE
ncbi:MAG: hypothetical protein JWR59_2526 [Brevundimonas sp.]|nr:hypothetical protein [Brevundimonas sp.]